MSAAEIGRPRTRTQQTRSDCLYMGELTMQQNAPSGKAAKTTRKVGLAVGRYLKDEKHAEQLIRDEKTLDTVITELIGYAEKDHNTAETEVQYGEALYNLLKLPLEAQKPIVWAIADRNKVKRPEYPAEDQVRGRGRPQTGRKQLAEALYGPWPEMLKLEGTNKDTRAGMQITDHKRRYMIRAGLMTEPVKEKAGVVVSRRVLRRSYEALWTVTKNEREQKLLAALFSRLGVEQDEMTEWKEEAEAEPTENTAA